MHGVRSHHLDGPINPTSQRVPQERGCLVAMGTGIIGVFQPGRTTVIIPVQQLIKALRNTLPPIIRPNTLMVLGVNMAFTFGRIMAEL